MTKRPRPTVHGRDHEHGGADVTLIHYEDVGGDGDGGGSSSPQARYALEYLDAPTTGVRYFEWTHTASDRPLLDLTDTATPKLLEAGVYAYNVFLSRTTSSFYWQAGDVAQLGFAAIGSLGFAAAVGGFTPIQPADTTHDYVNIGGCCVVHQLAGSDPDNPGIVYATVTNEMFDNPNPQNFGGSVLIQKIV
jgi:hypothetical protein